MRAPQILCSGITDEHKLRVRDVAKKGQGLVDQFALLTCGGAPVP